MAAGCAAMARAGPKATTVLEPTKGNTASGTVDFVQKGDKVVVDRHGRRTLARQPRLPHPREGRLQLGRRHERRRPLQPARQAACACLPTPDRHAGDMPMLVADAGGQRDARLSELDVHHDRRRRHRHRRPRPHRAQGPGRLQDAAHRQLRRARRLRRDHGSVMRAALPRGRPMRAGRVARMRSDAGRARGPCRLRVGQGRDGSHLRTRRRPRGGARGQLVRAATGTVRIVDFRDGVSLQVQLYNALAGHLSGRASRRRQLLVAQRSSPPVPPWAPPDAGRTPETLLPQFGVDTEQDLTQYVAFFRARSCRAHLSLRRALGRRSTTANSAARGAARVAEQSDGLRRARRVPARVLTRSGPPQRGRVSLQSAVVTSAAGVTMGFLADTQDPRSPASCRIARSPTASRAHASAKARRSRSRTSTTT